MNKKIIRHMAWLVLSSATVFFALTAWAGSKVDFSGKWRFDQARSKPAAGTSFSGSEVTLVIRHAGDSIEIAKTIKTPGGMEDTLTDNCTLDGKEYETTEGSIVTKRTGKWSSDGTGIILVQTVIMGSRTYTVEDVYALSDGGKVLTIQSTETLNAKVGKSVLVYEKQ